MTDKEEIMMQKVVNSIERHIRILKQTDTFDSDVVEEAVERWKNTE